MIVGRNIALKRLEQAELPVALAILRHSSIANQIHWDQTQITATNLPNLLTWGQSEEHSIAFGIWEIKTEHLVGIITLNGIEAAARSATVGLFAVHPDYGGHWYGVEAIRLLFRYAFDTLNLNRVVGLVFEGNRIAETIYKRIGAVKEAELREAVYKGGRYINKGVYSVLRREYEAEKRKWQADSTLTRQSARSGS